MIYGMQIVSLLVLVGVGIYASLSDGKTGRISNKVLGIASLYALFSDVVQYGILEKDLRAPFLVNMVILAAISLLLFFTHSWAGGDCKLLCTLGLFYPASCYWAYQGQATTLIFAVGIAFFSGYLYLVALYLRSLLKKQIRISLPRFRKALSAFLLSYLRTLVYITAVHLLYSLFDTKLLPLGTFSWLVIDFCIAWGLGSIPVLQKPVVCLLLLGIDVALSVLLGSFPLGTSVFPYLFVLVIVSVKILLTDQNYQVIPTAEVQKGMILSTATTLQFLQSRVKGLPELSTEDLRSRLTQEEAESVRRWEHSAMGKSQVVIVRKIPFAVFIFLGFVLYFVIWSVLG